MAHLIEIDAEPGIGEDAILAAIEAEGGHGAVMDVAPHLCLSVSGPDLATASRTVSLALERVNALQCRPLVQERTGLATFILRPPAG